jgi:HK97 family phage prohead protease
VTNQHSDPEETTLEHLNQHLEIKSLEQDGSFEGIAAAYGNVDSQGDRIEPGTFKAAEGEQIPLLFAHKTDQPIGFATVTETAQGLLVKGKLLLDTVAGSEAYSRLKAGVLKSLSVGFVLPKEGFSIKAGIRVISKAILKEISLVVFPANPLAAVTAVKDGMAGEAASGKACHFGGVVDYLN